MCVSHFSTRFLRKGSTRQPAGLTCSFPPRKPQSSSYLESTAGLRGLPGAPPTRPPLLTPPRGVTRLLRRRRQTGKRLHTSLQALRPAAYPKLGWEEGGALSPRDRRGSRGPRKPPDMPSSHSKKAQSHPLPYNRDCRFGGRLSEDTRPLRGAGLHG